MNLPLILLADDDLDSRDLYGDYLKRKGYRVALASSGREALDKAGMLQPDLIVLDLIMPDIGGEAATHRLRRDANTRNIPVILMTGHAAEGAAAVRKTSCQGFLIKPCEPESLAAEISRVLSPLQSSFPSNCRLES
jgi:CheY-like chemotaxis protein